MKKVTQGLLLESNIRIVEQPIINTFIELIEYNKEQAIVTLIKDLEDTKQALNSSTISWINIVGLHMSDQFNKLCEIYKIHPLILENIIKANQRPKIEDHDSYIFVTMKMLYNENNKYTSEQISFILGDNYLLSFQEVHKDVFSEVRNKLGSENSRLRSSNVNYLFYRLVESIVNNYEVILEDFTDKMNKVQDHLILRTKKVIIEDLFFLKNDLMYLRKKIVPICEIIHNLIKNDNTLLDKETKIYFKDLLVIVKNIIDTLDALQDNLMGLFDFHLTNKSTELNEIMKVLTMFSVPFMPLSFLAGLYGMNFDYLPELRQHYAYPILVTVMISIFIGILVFFKKKKWF